MMLVLSVAFATLFSWALRVGAQQATPQNDPCSTVRSKLDNYAAALARVEVQRDEARDELRAAQLMLAKIAEKSSAEKKEAPK